MIKEKNEYKRPQDCEGGKPARKVGKIFRSLKSPRDVFEIIFSSSTLSKRERKIL